MAQGAICGSHVHIFTCTSIINSRQRNGSSDTGTMHGNSKMWVLSFHGKWREQVSNREALAEIFLSFVGSFLFFHTTQAPFPRFVAACSKRACSLEETSDFLVGAPWPKSFIHPLKDKAKKQFWVMCDEHNQSKSFCQHQACSIMHSRQTFSLAKFTCCFRSVAVCFLTRRESEWNQKLECLAVLHGLWSVLWYRWVPLYPNMDNPNPCSIQSPFKIALTSLKC